MKTSLTLYYLDRSVGGTLFGATFSASRRCYESIRNKCRYRLSSTQSTSSCHVIRWSAAREQIKADDVTAEMLMRQVEDLLLMDELSEGQKIKILQNVLSILEEEK